MDGDLKIGQSTSNNIFKGMEKSNLAHDGKEFLIKQVELYIATLQNHTAGGDVIAQGEQFLLGRPAFGIIQREWRPWIVLRVLSQPRATRDEQAC